MTLIESPSAPSISVSVIDNTIRSDRLAHAGEGWAKRIDADQTSAKLTYRVRGVGEGSVATRVTAGHHELVVDEPDALAGDDLAARYEELRTVVDAHCPVFDLFANPTPVTVTVAKG